MTLPAHIIAHHLRLFGFPKAGIDEGSDPLVLDASRGEVVAQTRSAICSGRLTVALDPSDNFLSGFGVSRAPGRSAPPLIAHALHAGRRPWARLRSLHSAASFGSTGAANVLVPVVTAADGEAIWAWLPCDVGGMLLVGTELAADLVRYRQGDPSAAADRSNSELWGFAGERPLYLFERQLAGEDLGHRHADWWCWTLRDALERHGRLRAHAMLPGNAAGAVVVTGDDDQARLEMYDKQREALDGLPITYFLHPLTKHSKASLAALADGRRIELALHPDALDAPDRYGELFAQQAAWFQQLTGSPARMVRNHGYLNDGYWGHAASWRRAGVIGSSNLPGLDGRVINGSLLPARLALDGILTDHWSVLTAIGDGVVFIQGREGRAAGDVIRRIGKEVCDSGVPGVVVLNLHPDNIDQTWDMHTAARELVQDGFVAWTLSDMIDFFRARDAGISLPHTPAVSASLELGAAVARQDNVGTRTIGRSHGGRG